MKIWIETERLILREMEEYDAAGMYELDSNPEVHRYLGNNPVTSIEQVENVIQFVRQQYIDNGIGRWAVIEKSSGKFIGWSGLKLMKEPVNNHVNYYDVGYRLIQSFWGKGYATESAKAAIQFGFDKLNAEEIYAIANVDNFGSQNVLEKCGMKFLEVFDFDGTPHNWYRIGKSEKVGE